MEHRGIKAEAPIKKRKSKNIDWVNIYKIREIAFRMSFI